MTFSIFIPTTINTTSVAEMRREELIFHYLLGGSFDYWSDQLGVESSLEVWTEERRKLYHSFRYETGNIGMARRPGEIIVLLETWVISSSSSSSVLLRSSMFGEPGLVVTLELVR